MRPHPHDLSSPWSPAKGPQLPHSGEAGCHPARSEPTLSPQHSEGQCPPFALLLLRLPTGAMTHRLSGTVGADFFGIERIAAVRPPVPGRALGAPAHPGGASALPSSGRPALGDSGWFYEACSPAGTPVTLPGILLNGLFCALSLSLRGIGGEGRNFINKKLTVGGLNMTFDDGDHDGRATSI